MKASNKKAVKHDTLDMIKRKWNYISELTSKGVAERHYIVHNPFASLVVSNLVFEHVCLLS